MYIQVSIEYAGDFECIVRKYAGVLSDFECIVEENAGVIGDFECMAGEYAGAGKY